MYADSSSYENCQWNFLSIGICKTKYLRNFITGSKPRPHDWLMLGTPLLAALVLLALENTDVDRAVARWFFDSGGSVFPLRYNMFLETVLHQWTKYVVVLIACLTITAFLLSFILTALKPQRRVLLFLALSLILAPTTVSGLKLATNRHCPWDLQEFGGFLPYTRLLEPPPPGLKPGQCFPAGHASTGFVLMAFYFAGRARRRPDLAQAGLATGLASGMALGLGRMLQGAHFLSHVLWSAVVCWSVMALLYAVILRPQELAAAPQRNSA
jgi:membrane-associated PAP2 superfamily phosphatase